MVRLNEDEIVTISLTVLNHNKNDGWRMDTPNKNPNDKDFNNNDHNNNDHNNNDHNNNDHNCNFEAWLV